MFTPQEVSDKSFPKAAFGSGGYAMNAVDEFLDALTEDYASIYKENTTLKAKLKILAEKVEEYRATEEAMRSTLLTAQRMAAKLVQEAETEKTNLLDEAHRQHAEALEKLAAERAEAEQKLTMAQTSLAEFIRHSSDLCAQQVQFLQSLPELELAAQTTPGAPAAEELSDTVQRDILGAFAAVTAEESAAATDDAQSAAVEPAEESAAEPAIPGDFKLSLDELKFGRNYSGDK